MSPRNVLCPVLFSLLLPAFLSLPLLPGQQAVKGGDPGESALLRSLRPPAGSGASFYGKTAPSGKGTDGPFQAVKYYQSPAVLYNSAKRVDLLADRGACSSIIRSVALEMERVGWAVTLWSCRDGRPAEVRAFLQKRYAQDRIEGCFIIGDLPVAWFEMDDDFFLRHSEFPCDLYYMDLDGTWGDKDKDGIFDSHKASAKGDERPEIFVGRLTLGPGAGNIVQRLNAYLLKDFDFRAGGTPPSGKALSFRDDPWASLDTGQSKAWNNVKVVNAPAGTTASSWKSELETNYDSAVLCAESTATAHFFLVPGKGKESVTSAEIRDLSPGIFLLNLFGSGCGRFTEKNYLGEAYLFGRSRNLAVVASTKIGSMVFFSDFYAPLAKGASLGEAFLEWLRKRYPYGREQVRWFYGMTLLGDPTLRIQEPFLQSPSALLPRSGGKVDFVVDFPRWKGKAPYVVLGSFSNYGKGLYLPGVRIPLLKSPELIQFLSAAGSPLLPGWIGTLDGKGDAKAGVVWKGPLPSSLWNRSLYLSCLTLDPRGMASTSLLTVGIGRETRVTEDFSSTFAMDRDGSGAFWGQGKLVPGRIGGSGILGDFDYRVGSRKVGDVYIFDTSNTLIPGSRTLDGKSHLVRNGVFEFASFRIPKGVKVRFEGPYPARIFVRGSVRIDGTLDASGFSPKEVAKWNIVPEKGVTGGKGGPGGAPGGDGGSEPGKGTPAGKPGRDMLVPPGHPRKGKEIGTGGKGSAEHPLKLDPKKVRLDYYAVASIQVSAPGGGGGSFTSGGVGSLKQISLSTVHGKLVKPSNSFPFLPLVSGRSSLSQLLLGGAGGGGAGVCPWGSFSSRFPTWSRGNGGGGGGGALALRCGGNLFIGSSGAILAKGAPGGGAGASAGNCLSPGGGGGGGTLLFQVGGIATPGFQGMLDVRGGPSLKSRDLYNTVEMISAKGGDGYYRLETDPPRPYSLIYNAYPRPSSKNVGILADRDPVTGARSKFYTTFSYTAFLKNFVIEAKVNGKKVVYSDDPTRGIPPVLGKTPVAFFLQGGSRAKPQEPCTKWVTSARAFNDSRNWCDPRTAPRSFRWTILLDTSRIPSPGSLTIQKVVVTYAF